MVILSKNIIFELTIKADLKRRGGAVYLKFIVALELVTKLIFEIRVERLNQFILRRDFKEHPLLPPVRAFTRIRPI